MAFDQPLESDQIGDHALISLVTKPILGTLMWILGDEDDDDNNKHDDDRQEKALQQGLQNMILDDDDDDDDIDNGGHQPHQGLPRLARSDVSVGDRAATATDPPSLLPRRSSFTHLLDDSLHPSVYSEQQQQPTSTDKKKMSWSENLVEYMDDESQLHEPPSARSASDSPNTSMTRPIKSAMMMTRSTSIRSHSLHTGGTGQASSSYGSDGEEGSGKLRYLPSGLDKAAQHGSLRMPTRPDHYGSHHHHGSGSSSHHHHPPGGAAAAAGGGIESPQWGWYINTTPPTPEMFHSRSSLQKHNSERSSSDHSSSGASVYDPSNPATRGPNRVFQGLKAGSNRPPIGWPSVPL